jgi:hypothetical protein
MIQEQALTKLRQKFMSNRQVICTGNPNNLFTIAHGIKKIYPNATFLHKSNGWDLTDPALEAKIKEQFSKHNMFINASYISCGTQLRLLELCNQSVKYCDVVNIGSVHEYDNLGLPEYKKSKLDLRNLSLNLNTHRFKTCHLMLGHLKTNKDAHDRQIEIDTVCNLIPWVFEQSFEIPIMCIDSKKAPY